MVKYKVGDVVLSHGEPILGYGSSLDLSNQLCIVRDITDGFSMSVQANANTPLVIIYNCTLVSTGEYVALLGTEIVEQGADQ